MVSALPLVALGTYNVSHRQTSRDGLRIFSSLSRCSEAGSCGHDHFEMPLKTKMRYEELNLKLVDASMVESEMLGFPAELFGGAVRDITIKSYTTNLNLFYTLHHNLYFPKLIMISRNDLSSLLPP